MRNFRTAAVATATALTVALGGVATATAAETSPDAKEPATQIGEPGQAKEGENSAIFAGEKEGDKDFGEVVSDGVRGLLNGQGSSQFFNDTDKLFFGVDALGKETNSDNMPQWARYWIDGTVIAAIGSLAGLVIAGFNWASYNGWINL
ncbi:hypothetical protein SAMN04488535_0813 [Corynebacterium mycetoides]|uniref:Or membrane protein n=1 Tax=Corynebacterium mycetoides TaxID=38302 RepID=A0A1G9MZT4_9CORY|nr:hypothetical protein [Corynebacterium mycetoides]SDL79739.1 hypothetical protein SAMN04488535_0813 [Corynebacterium mycetoides]